MKKYFSIHIDIDSPLKLLAFYGIKNECYDEKLLNDFYKLAFERALDLFNEIGINATFFCVGDDLEKSEEAKKAIKNAHKNNHKIANHTYSHVYGLTQLQEKEQEEEIIKCSNIIYSIIWEKPIGFRAPGYDINTSIINKLENLGFLYDTSACWTLFNPLIKIYHKIFSQDNSVNSGFGDVKYNLKQYPYTPDFNDFMKINSNKRNIIEFPLPKTNILQLPFYSNFHLMTPDFFRNISIKNFNSNYFIYLMHIIEFVDLTDNIPSRIVNTS